VAASDEVLGIREGLVDVKKNSVILNGIDAGQFAGDRHYGPRRNQVIGTIGRIHAQKGQKYLIEAMPEVLIHFPDAQLRIVGTGVMLPELQARVGDLGIGPSVVFAGEKLNAPEELRTMDLFVLPSLWEGFPIVLLEAMASGIPIIASAVDGVVEMLRDGEEALLIPPAHAGVLSECLVRLLRDESLRRSLGESARKAVQERYSLTRMVRETEAVYAAEDK
jgi:glycosyltransferase involved in cell wall biosynthesis